MKRLNQYIYKRKVTKLLLNPIREKRFVDYSHAKTILLLFESDEREENHYIHKLIEDLTADGKKVSAIGYLDVKQVKTVILPTYKILDQQSFNFVKQPKDTFLQHFLQKRYDVLIDLTTNEILPLQYICLYANALTKVGTVNNAENVLDFVVKVSSQPGTEKTVEQKLKNNENRIDDLEKKNFDKEQQYLFEQIIFYLKKIKSKN